MNDDLDVSAEELSVRLEGSADGAAGQAGAGVAPGVLAAVVVGFLCAIALLFSLACLMDRWNRRLKQAKSSQILPPRSTKVTILDDMSPDPVSDPPAASLPGPSSEC